MKNIAVLCGGFSGEDVISLQSAETILAGLKDTKHQIFKVVLSNQGWEVKDMSGAKWELNALDFSLEKNGNRLTIDGVINVIHGTPGEDGNLQGYLNLLGIPHNGSNVLASSLSFNKGFCNHFLKQQGILVADSLMLTSSNDYSSDEIVEKLGLPCFVKPNDAGSSLGVSKVKSKEDLPRAIEHAFSISNRVLIESFIEGTEITCGVIVKNGKPLPLAVTEIVFANDFFDFEAKYNDNATQEITPARISEIDYRNTQETSVRIFNLLGCNGFFRADYILAKNGLYLIEVNTVPGMSAKSLLPQQLDYANENLSEVLEEQIVTMCGED
jgi:D-alanine-D-alanine ligase